MNFRKLRLKEIIIIKSYLSCARDFKKARIRGDNTLIWIVLALLSQVVSNRYSKVIKICRLNNYSKKQCLSPQLKKKNSHWNKRNSNRNKNARQTSSTLTEIFIQLISLKISWHHQTHRNGPLKIFDPTLICVLSTMKTLIWNWERNRSLRFRAPSNRTLTTKKLVILREFPVTQSETFLRKQR